LITPHHLIIPGNAWSSPVTGQRILTVDYAPVVLGDETFWVPAAITSHSISGAGTSIQSPGLSKPPTATSTSSK
ncbi:MAG TPA: hypothetical protein VGU23_03075, partial [Acidobacteriaceae bacterium]|nr:hypothetical protein [Acidobacteriaceae bacterium]